MHGYDNVIAPFQPMEDRVDVQNALATYDETHADSTGPA